MRQIKYALLIVVLGLSAAAYAAHGHHSWQKIKTEKGDGNWVICKWKCDGIYGKEAHTTETSGKGRCPSP